MNYEKRSEGECDDREEVLLVEVERPEWEEATARETDYTMVYRSTIHMPRTKTIDLPLHFFFYNIDYSIFFLAKTILTIQNTELSLTLFSEIKG